MAFARSNIKTQYIEDVASSAFLDMMFFLLRARWRFPALLEIQIGPPLFSNEEMQEKTCVVNFCLRTLLLFVFTKIIRNLLALVLTALQQYILSFQAKGGLVLMV